MAKANNPTVEELQGKIEELTKQLEEAGANNTPDAGSTELVKLLQEQIADNKKLLESINKPAPSSNVTELPDGHPAKMEEYELWKVKQKIKEEYNERTGQTESFAVFGEFEQIAKEGIRFISADQAATLNDQSHNTGYRYYKAAAASE